MPWRSRRIASTRSSRSPIELLVLLFDLAQFLLGEEIHRAEPLTLLFDALDLGLDLGDRRGLGIGLEFRDFGRGRRLDLQDFADFVLDIGEPAARAVVALLATRRLGAGFADRLQGNARGFVRLGEIGLGRRELVGGSAAFAGRGFDLADQRLALGFEFLWRVDQFGALVGRLVGALGERGDLGRRIVVAVVPFLPLGGDGAQPMMGKLGFSRDGLRLAALLGAGRALARDGGVDIGELAFDFGGVRQGGERCLGFSAGKLGLVARRRRCAGVLPGAPKGVRHCG